MVKIYIMDLHDPEDGALAYSLGFRTAKARAAFQNRHGAAWKMQPGVIASSRKDFTARAIATGTVHQMVRFSVPKRGSAADVLEGYVIRATYEDRAASIVANVSPTTQVRRGKSAQPAAGPLSD